MKVTVLWRSLIEAGLSIVVKRAAAASEEQLIGACLNFDARADEAQPLCACAAFSRSQRIMQAEEQKAAESSKSYQTERQINMGADYTSNPASDDDNDWENLSVSNPQILDSTSSNSSNEYQVKKIPVF